MSPIPPISRTVTVSWSPEAAFQRFTADFATWWPARTHSIGGPRLKRIVFECRSGGSIFEEHVDGRRFRWGEIVEWEPPRRVRFTWHPSREPATAQTVDVRFVPEGGGTRLELTATDWERWGPRASRARRGYDIGWAYVLHTWAGRRKTWMWWIDRIDALVGIVLRMRGGIEASIARAGGGMPRA